MARVTTHTKSNRGKHPYRCVECPEEIKPGQRYYEWHPRSGTRRKHVECGYPRPTQLSSSKMAVLQEAQEDAIKAIDAWSPEIDSPDISDVESALATLAEAARDVGSEYQEAVDNMPDSLQYGPTGEACSQAAQDCESYADGLEGWSPNDSEPYLPEPTPDDPDGIEERESKFEEWVEAVKDEARSAADDDFPEYQG